MRGEERTAASQTSKQHVINGTKCGCSSMGSERSAKRTKRSSGSFRATNAPSLGEGLGENTGPVLSLRLVRV